MQAAGLDTWAVLSGSRCGEGNVVTLVFTWLVTIVFYGFVFYWRGPELMAVCRSAGGWFGRLGCALWVSLW